MSKDVVYVDAEDGVIGSGSISNAVENGIRVRIARIILVNSKGELLIQKRSSTMSLPNKWDQSAAGHVDEGETYEMAASRELQEEMGVSNVKLSQVAKFYTEETDEEKIKKRFNVVFTGVYDGEVTIDNDEVSEFAWVSPEKLEAGIESSPDDYTKGFIETYGNYRESIDR